MFTNKITHSALEHTYLQNSISIILSAELGQLIKKSNFDLSNFVQQKYL